MVGVFFEKLKQIFRKSKIITNIYPFTFISPLNNYIIYHQLIRVTDIKSVLYTNPLFCQKHSIHPNFLRNFDFEICVSICKWLYKKKSKSDGIIYRSLQSSRGN